MGIRKRNNKNDEEEFILSAQFRFLSGILTYIIYYFITPKQSYDVFYFYKRQYIYF